MRATPNRQKQMTHLFDLLVANPDGVTVDEIVDGLGLRRGSVRLLIRMFRREFASQDVNLVCDRPAGGGQWLYRLVGDPTEAAPWVAYRRRSLDGQFVTFLAVVESLANATDGRSVDGRKARALLLHLTRAKQDLDLIDQTP